MSDKATPKVTRRQHITREEEADRCLNHTVYSGGSNLILGLIFLAVVFGVPLAQHVVEIRQNLAKQAAWNPTSGGPKPGLAPQIYDVFELLPSRERIGQAKGFWGYWDLIPSAESISAFESSLKENSVLTTALLPRTQLAMTSLLGAGNEKAYVGKDGWLFYRPDVEYLTSPGFLDPAQLKLRAHGATAIQPDPVKAILDFKEQLAARGIQLVVVPVPTKPMIVPEMLAGDSTSDLVLQNESFAKFQKVLDSNGVRVFDPTPTLWGLRLQPLWPTLSLYSRPFLRTDTHWSAYAVDKVAKELASLLKSDFGLKPESPTRLFQFVEEVSAVGDIAEMLKLPSDQTIFPKQKATMLKVFNEDRSPWHADRNSDVLLLGDSFSNIYSFESMGWGTGAGLAEQLSFYIGRPIDKIVRNAGGASAARRDLASQLAGGVDRLAHKKVVVYEFSMRDLAQGDWKLINLPLPPKVEPAPPVVVTPPAPPKNSLATTAFKNLFVTPNTLDLGKTGVVKIEAAVPPGNWQIAILTADGTPVRKLKGGASTVGFHAEDTWNGTDVRGQPVPAGEYKVRLEGERPDHSQIDPLEHSVTVTDSSQGTPGTQPAPVPPVAGGTSKPTNTKPAATTKPDVKHAKTEEGLIVSGRIAARSVTPKPGSVPYKDCLIALQLTDLKATGGTVKGPSIVVYVWGMRDNKLVDSAYSVGQTIRFKLVPWASVESKYGGFNRQELESDEALSWQAYWGEIK